MLKLKPKRKKNRRYWIVSSYWAASKDSYVLIAIFFYVGVSFFLHFILVNYSQLLNPFAARAIKHICATICHAHTHTYARTQSYKHMPLIILWATWNWNNWNILTHIHYIHTNKYMHTHTHIHTNTYTHAVCIK